MKDKNEICSSDETCSPEGAALQVRPGPVYKPRYTSHYDQHSWEVEVSLPGVKKEHLHVTVENEILEIRAARVTDVPEGWRPLADYPTEKNYRLRLDVGPEVDPTGIDADLKDGVLTLRLPLREEVKPRNIEVR